MMRTLATIAGLAIAFALVVGFGTGDSTPNEILNQVPDTAAPVTYRARTTSRQHRTVRTVRIVGRCVAAEDRSPLGACEVECRIGSRLLGRAMTRTDGRFAVELEAPRSGGLSVEVRAAGRRRLRVGWPTAPRELVDFGDVYLRRGAEVRSYFRSDQPIGRRLRQSALRSPRTKNR